MIAYKYCDKRRPLLIYTVSTCEKDDESYIVSWNAEDEEIYFGINKISKGVQQLFVKKDEFDNWVESMNFNIKLKQGANRK